MRHATTRKTMPQRAAALTLIATLAVGSTFGLVGCRSDPSQTTVDTNPKPIGITPVERGRIRREAITAAEAGLAAWKTNDVSAMKPYFADSYITYYTNLYKKYDKEGKVRVRDYDLVKAEASDMSKDGKQVLVDATILDKQYFKDKSGKALTTPSNKETYIQLTLNNKNGKWQITRMISGNVTLN